MRNNRTRLRLTAATILPLIATVLTLSPIAGRAHTGAGMVVFGAALCLTTARQGARATGRNLARRLALLPVTVAAGVIVAALFHTSLLLGDALFVATAVFATAGRAVGPRTTAIGQALLLPMLALFIAPVRLGPDPWKGLLWAAVAGVVALIWALLSEILIAPRPVPDSVPYPDPASGVTSPGVDGPGGGAGGSAGTRGKGWKSNVHVRRSAHSGIGLALAFAVGQVFFAEHWTWTVISAFTVGISARSRGDVVLKAVQRVVGAALGTLAATAVGILVAGRPVLTVALIIVLLAAGTYLREMNYLWWALCLTAVLALLYALDGVTGDLPLRLLAILVGGLCAVLPAVFLAPIRTRAVVRKRAAEALRSVRDAVRQADAASLARAHRDLAALKDSAKPLRWLRRGPELSWVDRLVSLGPQLDEPTTVERAAIAVSLREIGAQVRGVTR